VSGEGARRESWRVEASRTLIADPWMHLRAERCVTPRGVVLDPYYMLDYRDWAHVAAFDSDDNLVMARQYRHGAGALSLELPGGIVDTGEDAAAAAARELLEETGYAASALVPLAALSPNPSNYTNHLHLFLATDVQRRSAQNLDTGEDIAVELVPWRRAREMALDGQMINAAHVGLLWIALARTGRI